MTARKTPAWKQSAARQRQKRKSKKRVLIACEGQATERNYFDKMKRERNAQERFSVTVKHAKGWSRSQIAESAVHLKENASQPYDQHWCVFDAERRSSRADCEKAAKILQAKKFTVCFSNPSFEVWLWFHFERGLAAFDDGDAVLAKLKPVWKRRFDREYAKNDKDIYKLTSPCIETAITNARWAREDDDRANKCILDCNPATDVFKLVEELRGVDDD